MNKKTTLDRLAFALGVTLNQIDKLPVKPAGVDITDVNDVVVTDDTTCGAFSEYLKNLRDRMPPWDSYGCDNTKFLDNYNNWPCVSLVRSDAFPYIVIDNVGLSGEDPMKYFKDDGAFIQGVYKSLCEEISSGIKSGCLIPNHLLMKTYRDSIKKFDFKMYGDVMKPTFKGPRYLGEPITELTVFDGLFSSDLASEEAGCKRCLGSSIAFIKTVLDDLKNHFSEESRDLNGTIFVSPEDNFEKVFRKIWEEIIACTMDAIEPAGSV
jgi:hypothetical protein